MRLEIAMALGSDVPVVAPARAELADLARAAGRITLAEQGRAAVIAGRVRDALLTDRTPSDARSHTPASPSANASLLTNASIALHTAIATIPYLHEPPGIDPVLFAKPGGTAATKDVISTQVPGA
jgi:hypothetical protein